jgi:hypothetical protein
VARDKDVFSARETSVAEGKTFHKIVDDYEIISDKLLSS